MRRDDLPVERLRLDAENPRLPEDIRGADQATILQYLWDNASLEELIDSIATNGFFPHEPPIVLDEGETYTTLEGNRRLASLMILLRLPTATEVGLQSELAEPLSADRRHDLERIPCFIVDSRPEVRKFLGYRHIGGIKTWSAEAKARYQAEEVETVHGEAPATNPFAEVARRVGSNAQTVRGAYTAIEILRTARSEFGTDVRYIQQDRFGVWLRCMSAPLLRKYLGLPPKVTTYEQVVEGLAALNKENLEEVLRDLRPRPGTDLPLLNDSRDVTDYSRVLDNAQAREVLRKYSNLDLAIQVVEQAELPERIERIANGLQVLIDTSHEAPYTEGLTQATERLFSLARSLNSIVAGLRPPPQE